MNLLLLSVDSLRLDAVSRTNPALRTPRFDEAAAGFGFCDRCFSVSSATRPVHASLFTGLYPFEHGVVGQRGVSMRSGVPHLFGLFAANGGTAVGFSEAPEVFAGLAFAPWVQRAPPRPGDLAAALTWPATGRPMMAFVHYWGAHTPYGASDQRAWGEVWELLRSGRVDQVRRRYDRAVEGVFEGQIAPLLRRLDLRRWTVLLTGDHGQSWTAAEPYHGQTLANPVLRVPLYYHFPGTGNPPLRRRLASLVDVFPTAAAVCDLPTRYLGVGRDLRLERSDEPYLAEIDPGERPAGPPGTLPATGLVGGRPAGRQWALFDSERKFTWEEAEGRGRLERTLDGAPLPGAESAAPEYRARYARLREASPWAGLPAGPVDPGDRARLDERLRGLGYL